MKKTKFAVLLTAFMAVLGLSSCLGEPDPYFTGTEIMKVDGFMGFYSFKSAAGYTVEPTNSSVLTSDINTEYAWVTYKYDTRTTVINNDTKSINAEIQYLLPISDISYGYDEEPNVSIHTVSENVKFYDEYNIFIDLTYFYKSSDDQEDLKEELDQHSFYLTKATAENDDDVNDNTMVLNLVHQVADSDINKERKAWGTESRHFNLSYVLEGTKPEKIIIKFKQNSSSIDLVDSAYDSKIEINYKNIVDTYFPDGESNN